MRAAYMITGLVFMIGIGVVALLLRGVDTEPDPPEGLKEKVGAKMAGGEWSHWEGSGIVSVRSVSESYFADAKHSYQIGSGNKTEWTQN